MLRHVLVAALDRWLVEARLDHSALEIVGHQRAHDAAEEVERADMAADEIVHLLRVGRFRVRVV